nr:MAG TPA: Protein of unknown function (DUF2659) [Caudoviricetes sp.]
MKKVFSKEKVKKFWKENKEIVIGAGVAIGGVAAAMTYIIHENKKIEAVGQEIINGFKKAKETFDEYECGRDCLMTFTDEETGEKLGSVRCTESYVHDWVNSGLLAEIIEHDYNVKQDETEQ